MFDALVQDFGSRFDLGGKAGALVRSALNYMFHEEPGGLTGFLDRFRKAGLGDLASSWLGNSSPRELTQGQLEGALGGSVLKQMADKAGLSVSQVTTVLPLLLPKLIGMMTADGKVPSAIPAGVSSWLGGAAKTVGTYRAEPAGATVGTYRAEPTGPTVGAYREPVREPVAAGRSMWFWLVPLLGLGALGLLWANWPTIRGVPTVTSERIPLTSPATSPGPATANMWPVKIYFATGSQTLGPDDSARVQQAAAYLKANPGAVVDIAGFADPPGAAATNEDLAKQRAGVVRGALVALGVPESRTNVVPPVAVAGGGSDAEARRVEIRLKR